MSETKKKQWAVHTVNTGESVKVNPIFEVAKKEGDTTTLGVPSLSDKDVECRFVEFIVKDESGKDKLMVFNYLDLYMFIYFCANEELRQQLQQRYERVVHQIPYDVTFKISEDEKKSGEARRRIELPVDELTMAVARNQSMKFMGMPVLPNNLRKGDKEAAAYDIRSKLPKSR